MPEDAVSTESSPRDRILAAAATVFAEAGFDGARVDEIARRAVVNKAMLYYHVGDKATLYAAVLERGFDRLIDAVDRVGGERTPAAESLRDTVGALIELMVEAPEHPRIMLREVASGGAHLPDAVATRMIGLYGRVAELLDRGMREGAFRDVQPLLTHWMVVGAIVLMTATAPLRGRLGALGLDVEVPDSPTDLAAFLTDMLIHGLAARGASGGHR